MEAAFYLEVIGGDDRGACVELGASECVIGRAPGCHLLLSDPAVSRRHAIVARTREGKFRLEVLAKASPALVNGNVCHRVELELETRFMIGNSTIQMRSAETTSAPSSARDRGTIPTVLTGDGIDAWHLTALHALVAMLDEVKDVSDLEACMRVWCRKHSLATDVRLDVSTDSALVEDDSGMVYLVVDVPDDSAKLLFTCRPFADGVPASLQRTLQLASRLFAFALAHTRRRNDAVARAMSFGTAQMFLGKSDAARKISRFIQRMSVKDANVLLTGETGTGKSFVARLLHESGNRAKKPFKDINCARIPESLIESELFGHERGAFTGANTIRVGVFEGVGDGTLFLDEIGELPLPTQAKLLHVLEERRFERLGSNRTIPLRARIICATNRDLSKMVSAGTFREDLFHRIAVVVEEIPSLRERGKDLPLLAEHILSDLRASSGRRIDGFSKEALEAIAQYSWPGNVRALRNAIERAIALGDGPRIEASNLGIAVPQGSSESSWTVTLPQSSAWLERRAIEAALEKTGGHLTETAEMLGITRQTIYNKLAGFGSETTASKRNNRR
jgi:two-component system response regulator HydG